MKNVKLLFISIPILSIASCTPIYYVPNAQNVPLISEKEERNITATFFADQINLQGAYGLSKNFAVQANGFLSQQVSLNENIRGSASFIELGGGYFKSLPNHFVFETYGLVAIGSVKNDFNYSSREFPQYSSTIGQLRATTFRIGLQPNFGYKSKHFAAMISSRFVRLSYSGIKGDLMDGSENQVDYLKSNASNFLIEPAVTIRGGFEQAKLQLQYGRSLNISNVDFKQNEVFFSIGINVTLK